MLVYQKVVERGHGPTFCDPKICWHCPKQTFPPPKRQGFDLDVFFALTDTPAEN